MGFPATVFAQGLGARFPVTVVLGASGRIGQVLRRTWPDLLPDAARVRWQARRPQPDVGPSEDWVVLDPLKEPGALIETLRGAGAVLCLAGSVPGRSADLADNARLALAAIEAAASAGGKPPRVFLASSAAVYGGQAGLLREDAAATPTSPYGRAKREMEQQALARGQELGVPVSILRIGNIAGLDAILGGWRPGFTLDRFADGSSPRRSYIGVQSLAHVLAALLICEEVPAVLNIAQPEPVAMAALLQAAGRAFTTRPAPDSAIPEVALDLDLLRRILGPQAMPPPADPACLVAEWALLEPDFTR
jgi:nucleoside-diphosphate-sugar epimerase